MKTATVGQLRTEFPKVLAWVDAGEIVANTRRGKRVAELGPVGNQLKAKLKWPDFRARLKRIYGDKVLPGTATELILDYSRGNY